MPKELSPSDQHIINELNKKILENPNYLDFLGSDTKDFTHGYHTYPAMMIPQIPRILINLVKKYSDTEIHNIYDPFTGSGTTLVEGILAGLDSYGNDINPLSILMTKAKTEVIDPKYLYDQINDLKIKISNFSEENRVFDIPKFPKIDFWFKPEIIAKLSILKSAIYDISNEPFKNFAIAAFTETVRYVSNTRNNEFKLYRMPPEKLDAWNPNVYEVFFNNIDANFSGNNELFEHLHNKTSNVTVKLGSSMQMNKLYDDDSFDLLVTSPPYGDSGTTVAYGQFSRLSLQWLNLDPNVEDDIIKLDRIMLGGKANKNLNDEEALHYLSSNTLSDIYKNIKQIDEKRAREVLQFYADLDIVLENTSKVMKNNSYQFWVVANRTVKGYQVPTDKIITEMYQKYGVFHLTSFYRNIPNKRMPKLNSPTNEKGKLMQTMTRETILMLKKI